MQMQLAVLAVDPCGQEFTRTSFCPQAVHRKQDSPSPYHVALHWQTDTSDVDPAGQSYVLVALYMQLLHAVHAVEDGAPMVVE